jgi:hypothetical protein
VSTPALIVLNSGLFYMIYWARGKYLNAMPLYILQPKQILQPFGLNVEVS